MAAVCKWSRRSEAGIDVSGTLERDKLLESILCNLLLMKAKKKNQIT